MYGVRTAKAHNYKEKQHYKTKIHTLPVLIVWIENVSAIKSSPTAVGISVLFSITATGTLASMSTWFISRLWKGRENW